MRWGVLTNLAVILTISGLLLFAVFSAGLERAGIDLNVQMAESLTNIARSRINSADTPEELWANVRELCRAHLGADLLLFDPDGKLAGGCYPNKSPKNINPPEQGRHIRVMGWGWPANLFRGMTLVSDVTDSFPHDIKTIRIVIHLPPSVLAPEWRLFAAYLALTQCALFFLGYILFHRTVIGPIIEIAALANKGVRMTSGLPQDVTHHGRSDFARIALGIRSMLSQMLKDRDGLERLVEELQRTNTDLAAAQRQVIRSEKMAGVGKLAAGMAHEVGNPLQIIMGYSALLAREATSERSREMLSRVDQELSRIDSILRRLLDYARPEQKKVELCRINDLLQDCAALAQVRKDCKRCTLNLDLDPTLETVRTEPHKLRQIIINLMFNAADAITHDTGEITLRSRKLSGEFEISVLDNGKGIPEDYMHSIFDPFVTTKETGEGAGLGLPVSLGLIESMHGSIVLDSCEGHGTTVTIRAPDIGEDPER